MRLGRSIVLGLIVAGLCGCMSHPIQRPYWARFGNTSTADSGPIYHRDPYHQYFDKMTNRFYYYDPVQKQFFWENGQPKV